jgi:DNA ligase D-like protein (predicted ligase)/DNA ligase D-like protein (predicted polymerase)/DNA ligase D-like protein (predicted 3'-phosphoesterase)
MVQVGKRKVELSNLRKVLFPGEGIVKAQLVEYYLQMAPTILAHLKGRPLSLVRYPDGIDGESFFQKNRPDWAPDWLEHVTLGEEQKDYVLATEAASLVWLANLACIELHQMHARAPHHENPDYVVYDFDPPEGLKFGQVTEMALAFREHLQRHGYHPFVKTTGRKGLHVVTPIEPRWDFQRSFEAAKALAQPFVEAHGSVLTLQIKKDHRKGKMLLDIYRNRPSQTIIAAYSVRGLEGAPVSCPLTWEELETLASPDQFRLENVPERVRRRGDPWETIDGYAAALHTARQSRSQIRNPNIETRRKSEYQTQKTRNGQKEAQPAEPSGDEEVRRARKHKTPEQLEQYARKRSFDRTVEPAPQASESGGAGNSFVVHRHHASRLHYDLRLEQDGVLKSWAVPKGLPPRPGIKRLAVQVEDHPLEYADFEGAIPKGEYGGGMMWKFARGRYEITKAKEDGFYFRLFSRELSAEFRTHRTKENQWLLERVDAPQTDWLRDAVEPMLSRAATGLPNSEDYVYEVKWDGLRALIALDEGSVTIRGRNGLDLTRQFPELRAAEQSFRATSALVDGEIVCLDPDGRPNFRDVIHRMQQKTEAAIQRARAKHPAFCYVFDCLYLDGRAIVSEPLVRRREWLQDAIRRESPYRVSEIVEEGEPFWAAVRQMGLEGIMAKQRRSAYLPGKRSDAWLKIKARQTMECRIIGYTAGKGDRQGSFGALHLAREEGGELRYIGKVGGGFDESGLKGVSAMVRELKTVARPVKEKPLDEARTVWVDPKLACEVQYASITPDGLLREPVFVRLRPDLAADSR